MLKGTLALAIRYVLMIAAGGLVTAGLITSTGANHYCFDLEAVTQATASGVTMLLGGVASGAVSVGWRKWVTKQPGGKL